MAVRRAAEEARRPPGRGGRRRPCAGPAGPRAGRGRPRRRDRPRCQLRRRSRFAYVGGLRRGRAAGEARRAPRRDGLRARVRPVVDAAEPLGVDVAVDLRRRQRASGRAAPGSCAGRRRPRAGASRKRGAGGAGAARAGGASTCPGAGRGPRGRARRPRRARARPRLTQVAREPVGRLLAERDDAILAALAVADVDELLLEVDVGEIERDRLRAPQARRVDELDERAVAERERLARRSSASSARRPRPRCGASGSRRGRRGASGASGTRPARARSAAARGRRRASVRSSRARAAAGSRAPDRGRRRSRRERGRRRRRSAPRSPSQAAKWRRSAA